MNLPLKIAKRYLFAKKSNNIINIVSKISVIGIAVCTMAMVIVLSGFNGIEGIVRDIHGTFGADLEIKPKYGKSFTPSDIDTAELNKITEIKYYSGVIEETVIIEKNNKRKTCKIKGVEPNYLFNAGFEKTKTEGHLDLQIDKTNYCFPSYNLQVELNFSSDPRSENILSISGMARNKKISIRSNPLKNKKILVGGIFSDDSPNSGNYLFTSLEFTKQFLEYEDELTSFEIFLKPESLKYLYKVKGKVKEIIGDKFEIKTREEQNSIVFKATKTEKIAVYIILCFVLIIAAFSLVASLTLLILDKRKDVQTLYSIGFTRKDVRNLFFYEGLLINVLGGAIGIAIGLTICFIQIKTGILPMDEFTSFPIIIKGMDLVNIIVTVFVIGLILSFFPVKYLVKRLEI